jgi:hypothetical protein
LPLAAKVSTEQSRLAVLTSQVEASDLASSIHNGSLEEKLHVFVLPENAAPDRAVAFLSSAADALHARGMLREVSAIKVGDAVPLPVSGALLPGESPLLRRPLSLSLVVRWDGLQSLFSLLDLSGRLTLRDALTTEQVRELFTLTESENPTGIVALGQFLSADLLSYLREPRATDERLLSQFSSDAFPAELSRLSQAPFLKQERELLASGYGDLLVNQQLWPLPYLRVSRVENEELPDGWVRLSLELELVGRGKGA